MDEYEYQAQWWFEQAQTWMPAGWRAVSVWTTGEQARNILKELQESWPMECKFRIIRRRAPGPVEVVELIDSPQKV